ncbi:potassium/sodium hyperpolarization-activated cyclic nucleotide-gated channel 2 [Drosophila santomea]|uniref:potassium/sodium hyperpolarization-activated cyclic nucleotide-gated channel 2 n=1 Tax=Drosophila santomea TaxID=129105 RepID=UPI001953BBEF|nr:potassium/sodium hyperpolarization-activated cyclic nucleotide-gated channel 2 [Drosophila santomea]
MKSWYLALSLLLLAASTFQPSDARGGRGRGGGSFGGLFGGWRKYKKPASSGSGRRVLSGSPVHTAMTMPNPPPPAPPKMPMMPPKQQIPSYPRQQMPPGYGFGSYPGQGSGTYYANAQALPAGAVYYAQPPVGMNRGMGTGDFLAGMLATHMMSKVLFGHRHQTYPRNPLEEQSSPQGSGRQIIIVNNGQQQGPALHNETTISGEASAVVPPENPLTEEEDAEGQGEGEVSASVSSEESKELGATPQPYPDGGIICFPIMLNETDPDNSEVMREVERVACFPAPPPNPENFQPTITTEPPIVAGDIIDEADDGSEGGGADDVSHAGTPIDVANLVAARHGDVETDSI